MTYVAHSPLTPLAFAERVGVLSRETLPRSKAPSALEFGQLPKASTGKVRKYELREGARGVR